MLYLLRILLNMWAHRSIIPSSISMNYHVLINDTIFLIIPPYRSEFDAAWNSERGQKIMKALDEMMNPPPPPVPEPKDDENLD